MNQIKRNLLPQEIAKTIDLDRIAEDEENFLQFDIKRKMAINGDKLRPVIKGVSAYDFDPRTPKRLQSFRNNVIPNQPEKYEVKERSIIGDTIIFNQGHVLKNMKLTTKKKL